MDFIRELWKIRCGYIKAESILTAEQILRKRTQRIHDDNAHRKDSIGVIDRHLFEKNASYFYTLSLDTLEIWERKVKEVLKHVDTVPISQPTIVETVNNLRRDYIIPEVGDDSEGIRRKRQARFCSNMDPVWHKRLKLSFGYVRKRVGIRTALTQTVKQKFQRLKYQISRINSRSRPCTEGALCVQFNNTVNSFNSEWS